MWKQLFIPVSVLVALYATTAVEVEAASVSVNVALTSDYVFRGISQTRGDPALQAGARLGLDSGVYVSTWASGLKPLPDNGADAELDLVAGWSGALGDQWTLDANVTRYTYPGAERSSSDYNELVGTLTWRGRAWILAGWSNDVFGSGRAALYTGVGGRLPLAHDVAIESGVGRYDLANALGRSYVHAYVAVDYTHAAFTFRAALHDTDHAARILFPQLAGPRLELSASYAF